MFPNSIKSDGEDSQIEGWSMNKEVSQPLLLSIPQVCKMLSLSRTKVYELIHVEGLPVVRFGKAVRVSPVSLQHWLERRKSA